MPIAPSEALDCQPDHYGHVVIPASGYWYIGNGIYQWKLQSLSSSLHSRRKCTPLPNKQPLNWNQVATGENAMIAAACGQVLKRSWVTQGKKEASEHATARLNAASSESTTDDCRSPAQ